MLLQNAKPEMERTVAEDGYLLLTVLVMIFLMLLALSVAAPKVAKEIQRDKELEAVQRGLQYRRALQLYYKKFGAYPTDIKQLENTNEIRFLRKRYKDPITGKDDWRLIHMGEAKVPPMGFFGQPLQAGMSSVSTGPGLAGGSIYAPTNTDGSGGTNGSSSTTGSTSGSGSGSGFGFSNSGSNSGSSSGGFGSSGSGFGSSSGGFGSTSSGFGSTSSGGVGTTPAGTNGPGASSGNSSSTFGSAGPIVGVGIPVKKDSILTYHKQKKYSDWEFVYDPQTDLVMAGGATGGGSGNGNPAGMGTSGTNGTSSGGTGTSGGFGFSNGGSSGSSGSGFGSSGSGFGSSGSGFGSSGPGFGSSGSGSAPGSNPPSSPQ